MLTNIAQCCPEQVNDYQIIDCWLIFKGFEIFGGRKSNEIDANSMEINGHGVNRQALMKSFENQQKLIIGGKPMKTNELRSFFR